MTHQRRITGMTENIDNLAADIREVDGDHTLSAGALAEALVAKGWTKVIAPAHKALKDYQYGDLVVVTGPDFKEHDGRVANVEKSMNLVQVDTERGPVTINNPSRIRAQES